MSYFAECPEWVSCQSCKWAKIAETGKFVRVIVLADGETVHNAFFDRSFKEGSDES